MLSALHRHRTDMQKNGNGVPGRSFALGGNMKPVNYISFWFKLIKCEDFLISFVLHCHNSILAPAQQMD